MLISHSSNSSSLVFCGTNWLILFEKNLASLCCACGDGTDLPSSYVRLEWELDGFDGPISYCTVLCCAACCIQTETDGDGDIRKQQEKDIVTCIPPFVRPRPVVEKIYNYKVRTTGMKIGR